MAIKVIEGPCEYCEAFSSSLLRKCPPSHLFHYVLCCSYRSIVRETYDIPAGIRSINVWNLRRVRFRGFVPKNERLKNAKLAGNAMSDRCHQELLPLLDNRNKFCNLYPLANWETVPVQKFVFRDQGIDQLLARTSCLWWHNPSENFELRLLQIKAWFHAHLVLKWFSFRERISRKRERVTVLTRPVWQRS